MTIFLLRYDRRAGKLLRLDRFAMSEEEDALEARLEAELEINRLGLDEEAVLLLAESEQQLRHTHGNYFYSLTELADKLLRAAS